MPDKPLPCRDEFRRLSGGLSVSIFNSIQFIIRLIEVTVTLTLELVTAAVPRNWLDGPK